MKEKLNVQEMNGSLFYLRFEAWEIPETDNSFRVIFSGKYAVSAKADTPNRVFYDIQKFAESIMQDHGVKITSYDEPDNYKLIIQELRYLEDCQTSRLYV